MSLIQRETDLDEDKRRWHSSLRKHWVLCTEEHQLTYEMSSVIIILISLLETQEVHETIFSTLPLIIILVTHLKGRDESRGMDGKNMLGFTAFLVVRI